MDLQEAPAGERDDQGGAWGSVEVESGYEYGKEVSLEADAATVGAVGIQGESSTGVLCQ